MKILLASVPYHYGIATLNNCWHAVLSLRYNDKASLIHGKIDTHSRWRPGISSCNTAITQIFTLVKSLCWQFQDNRTSGHGMWSKA
jgi:hypothetical protein